EMSRSRSSSPVEEEVRGVTSQQKIQSAIESWMFLERRGGSTHMKEDESIQDVCFPRETPGRCLRSPEGHGDESKLGRPDRRVERYLSDAARNSPELCWDQERRAFLPPQPSLTHPQQKQQRSGRGKTIANPESLTPGSTRSSQRVESEVQDSELIPLFLSGLQ
ncbi:Alpha/beta hydrolase domain containing protein 17C, partial [Dissostichus eleginoides]